MRAPIPGNESDRLEALRDYRVLDTAPDQALDDLSSLAATICGTPMAVISMVDECRQWFKSRVGIDVAETPRDIAFCSHTILQRELLVVEDARLDPRFSDNPMVTGGPGIRFYAGAPLVTPSGLAIGTLCVFDTEVHQLSETQRRALEVLTRQVVAHLELRRARDQAEAASAARSRFLASISHEIRTPLNCLLGNLELLGETKLDGDQARYFEALRNSGGNISVLMSDLLDLSKMEAGQMDLESAHFDLAEILTSCLDLTSQPAMRRGLELSLVISPDLPLRVTGDANRVRQVLLNLISNAIKFTESGSVLIEAAPDPRFPGELKFSVTDTGCGIAPDRIGELFTAFTQVDGSTTRAAGGAGIGLGIARKLVDLMGGRMNVVSEPGRGSTFSFNLPLPEAPAPTLTAGVMGQLIAAASETAEPSLRILLVDDAEENRALVMNYLKRTEHRVEPVASGTEAIERFGANDYDVVLMDLQMPGMDGYDTTRRLRELEATKGRAKTPIIALTAYALREEMEKSRAAGCDGHVTKPVSKTTLIELLQTFSPRVA